MELNFNKEGNVWVADFEATSDFNLHLERSDDGLIKVMQRGTTEGEYVDSFITSGDNQMKNFDCDFAALVYPKYIKVISGTEVITASVNFNEGGGSGSGSGDQLSYYRVNSNDDSYNTDRLNSVNGFCLMKGIPSDTGSIYDGDMCITVPDTIANWSSIIAVCAPASPMKFKDKIINYGDWKRNYAENNVTIWPELSIEQVLNDYKFLEPITKEQFYNLES